ncbi:MAG: hypothetical protein Q9186_006790 [Xanthomendoza sp. 1 TL-2023]
MMQSAVRLPTPPPLDAYSTYSTIGRKRSPPSRSPSPLRRRSPPRNLDRSTQIFKDVNPQRAMERERQLAERLRKQEPEPTKPPTEEEKQAAAKTEYEKLLNSRSGGTYIPPARLRALQAQITDKKSKEYQRMAWEALKKSINGLINKVNVSNIKHIVPELFTENLVRGRGLFCRSIMKAAASSSGFVSIYAAMAAIVNTKLPQVGELLVHRLIVQFKKAFKRNDKAVCLSSTMFIAHLVNQQVVHEILAAQILLLLLNKPTDDSVEISVGLTREVGQHLEEMSGPIALAVFDQFRSILHEQDMDKRVQYMIEVLFQVRKDKYKDNPAIKDELDLVEEEDQITHQASLDDEFDVQDRLNVFKFDAEWEEHEEAYQKLKAEILGEADGSDDEEDETDESSDDEGAKEEKELEIKDQTNTDLTNLRRTIYLTIMSSLDFEEAVHKLLKVNLPVGQEPELPSMIVECCSQERTYSKFYGLIGERFAKLNRLWTELFEQSFAKYYDTIHRYETNRLRNIARFFGHLLSSGGIGWHVLSVVHLNEDETTSSSRIFIKILIQDLAEALGMPKLQARLKDDMLRPSYEGLFPTDNPRNTRFSINYFTSIGMGALTDEMREHLKNAPKPAALMPAAAESDSESESSVSSRIPNHVRHHVLVPYTGGLDHIPAHVLLHLRGGRKQPVEDHTPGHHHLHHGRVTGIDDLVRDLSVLGAHAEASDPHVDHTRGRVVLQSGKEQDGTRVRHLDHVALAADAVDHLPAQYFGIGGGDVNILSIRNRFEISDQVLVGSWSIVAYSLTLESYANFTPNLEALLHLQHLYLSSIEKSQSTTLAATLIRRSPTDLEAVQEGRSGAHRSKKKHERNAEIANKDRTSNASRKELTSPPSLLSRIQASSPPLPYSSNDLTSPLLGALGTFPASEDISKPVHSEGEWPENISSRENSSSNQINGFSLAASPSQANQTTKGYSGGFSKASPAPSPPTTYAKFARRTSGYQSLGGYLSSSPGRDRPASGHSPRSTSHNPPLPHYPQAHFYTAPQVNLGVSQEGQGSQGPAIRGCRVFDNLASAGVEGFGGAESVLLVGSHNALDLFSFDNGRVDRIGCLANLGGTVLGAQLLPSLSQSNAASSSGPLVALVVRRPQQSQHSVSHRSFRNESDEALFDPSASTMEAFEQTETMDPARDTRFQTTVEIYSLGKCEHIATLLRCAPTEDHRIPQDASRSAGAQPDGEWRIQVCGRFLTVGSGRSGEVFIFEFGYGSERESSLTFKCIGKTWTSVSQQVSRTRSASSTEAHKLVSEDDAGIALHRTEVAISSLSHRWLAVVSPNKSTKTTVHASVDLLHSDHKPPGLSSHRSPQSPQATCDLDTPGQESLLNKVARDVTQEFMKGARWVGDQGMRAWKGYWQKPTDPSTVPRLLPENAHLPPLHDQLPPTHANDDHSSRPVNQRVIVSIIDLGRLSANQSGKDEVALQPLAAFALPDGCSLVSFTPNGLELLTASAKGDVQHVWSLMRMAHGASVSQTDSSHVYKAPSVRQIARFTRMTVARIVDVVWTEPGGERFALVTERGTVHIYDLPPSALQWPPPRRTLKPAISTTQSLQSSPELEPAVPANPSSGRLGSAMDMVTARTQPLLAAVRGRPASMGNPFGGFSSMSLTAGAGIKSGKVVAAGFNRSVGAATGTVDTIRHLGENRLSLPGPSHAAAPGRVWWLGGRNRGYMAVIGGDSLRIHRISHSANTKPGKRRPSVVGNKPVELSLIDAIRNPAKDRQWRTRTEAEQANQSRGFWQARPARPVSGGEEDSVHSQAEIDTNAPYQPFHTDRRVNLHVYSQDGTWPETCYLEDSSPWAFGEDICTIRTRAGAAMTDEMDNSDVEQHGGMENHVSVLGNEKEGQQIVITTRRRKAAKADKGEGGEEEIFEDDCEVVDFADERV